MPAFLDAQGFVIGGTPQDWKAATGVWADVRRDVAVIRSILERGAGRSGGAVAERERTAKAIGRAVAEAIAPRGRSGSASGGSSVAAIAARAATHAAVTTARRGVPAPSSPAARAAAQQARAANGRFLPGQRSPAAAAKQQERSDRESSKLRGRIGDFLKELGPLADRTADADPALAAANEIREVVTPMARGFAKLFGLGAEKQKLGWLKRIFKAVDNLGRRSAGITLGGAPSGGPSLLSRLGGWLGLGGAAAGGAAAGAAGARGAGGAARAGLAGMGARALGAAKGALTRFGPIAALLQAGNGLRNDFKIATDASGNKTDRRLTNAANTGAAVGGSVGGAALGAAIGSALLPGIGTIVGGALGAWFGPDLVKMLAGQLSPLIGKAVEFLTDAAAKVKGAYDAAVDATSGAIEAVAGSKPVAAAKAGYQQAVSGASTAIEAGAGLGRWALGKVSSMFESGRRGAGAVSSGRGDFGGKSYGTYQLASNNGSLQAFLKASPYGAQFAGLAPGSAEFDAKWKQLAASDPGFGAAQHDYIKATHYDPQMAKLKAGGLDLSGRGAAVQEAIWSTAVQFGASSGLIQKALAGKNVGAMSDAAIVSAIQDFKLANNDRLFRSSSASVRASTFQRAGAEKAQLLALAAQYGDAPLDGAPQAKVPMASPVPRAPMIPLRAAGDVTNNVTNNPPPRIDIGQDVGDRTIAHIVTGGIGKG